MNAQQLAALRALSSQAEDERARLSAELKADFDAKAEEVQAQVASLDAEATRQQVCTCTQLAGVPPGSPAAACQGSCTAVSLHACSRPCCRQSADRPSAAQELRPTLAAARLCQRTHAATHAAVRNAGRTGPAAVSAHARGRRRCCAGGLR